MEPTTTNDLDDWFCCWSNSTNRMAIVRCCGPREFFLERVVFPFEHLSFACPPGTDVEIWSHGLGGAELVASHPARELRLEPSESSPPPGPQSGLAGLMPPTAWA
jgi:hypothetical protein